MPKKKKLTKEEKKKQLINNGKVLKRFLKVKKDFMGIDIGTQITGFYSDRNEGLAIYGGPKNTRMKRMHIIKNTFMKIECSGSIAIIEDYAFTRNISSLSQLAELGGIIRLLLYESQIPYLTLAPQTLKKFVLGPSRGSKTGKQFILLEVFDRWGKKFNDDNIADAFCLHMFLKNLKQYLLGEKDFLKWEQQMFNDFITNRGLPEVLL